MGAKRAPAMSNRSCAASSRPKVTSPLLMLTLRHSANAFVKEHRQVFGQANGRHRALHAAGDFLDFLRVGEMKPSPITAQGAAHGAVVDAHVAAQTGHHIAAARFTSRMHLTISSITTSRWRAASSTV